MFQKRKDFVKKIMEIASIEGFQQADEIAQAVIKMFQVSIGDILSKEISETVPPDLSEGWNLIVKRKYFGAIDTIEKRKDFIKQVMDVTNITDYKRADEIAQVVIKLIQLTVGEKLSRKISDTITPDLKKGWDSIEKKELEKMAG